MPYFLFYLEAFFGHGGSQVNVEKKDDVWMIKAQENEYDFSTTVEVGGNNSLGILKLPTQKKK